jgi:hypothetical protein
MRKIFNIFTFVFLSVNCANATSVVGTVNGKAVTDSDITARTELMTRQGKTSKTNRKQAFQNIIDDYIKLDYAANYNVKPTDKEADQELKKMNLGEMGATMRSMARLAVRANIAWNIMMSLTVVPGIEVTKSDIDEERNSLAREYGLPIEVTMLRLVDVPDDIYTKLSKPKNCAAAEEMVENLGGVPQKITALQYELAADVRERISGLPLLTWSKKENNTVFLVCSEKKGKEYKNLDEIIKQNATYKKASAAAEQQLKQLRRKAVIIVNDDRYKL